MDTFNYFGQQLSIDPTAYKMGEQSFQSFLLAGERNIVSGLNKKNTDEERFETFFKALNLSQQENLRDHFKRQAQLNSVDRRELFGSLDRLKITDPLTLETASRDLIADPIHRPGLRQMVQARIDTSQISQLDTPPQSALAGKRKMTLNLEEIKILEAQDGNWKWGIPNWKRRNEVDEVLLKIVAIDEFGKVSRRDFDFGSIKEGKKKSFRDKELCSFDLNSQAWPKNLTMLCFAIEKDGAGDLESIFKDIIDYLEGKIEEGIASGIIGIGAYFGVTIPKPVADKLASYVKGFLDKALKWWAKLKDKDDKYHDSIGQVQLRFQVDKNLFKWTRSNRRKSTSADWDFYGGAGAKDAHWRARIHLKLFEEVVGQTIREAS